MHEETPRPTPTPSPRASRPYEIPDLHTQLEEMLNSVWTAEKNWRLDDRLDLALKHNRRLV